MHSKAAPHRILIVCNEATRQPLLEVLGIRGDQVVSTCSGTEALWRLQLERFDVVIVDIDLPGIRHGEFFAKASTLAPDDAAPGIQGG
jgi:CheY-like chemotaxis protein